MRLIDADELKKVFIRKDDEQYFTIEIKNVIDSAPTVDKGYQEGHVDGVLQAEKLYARPQGEWIIKTGVVSNYSACSLCDFADYRHLHFNYCPGCGARMTFGGKLCGGES